MYNVFFRFITINIVIRLKSQMQRKFFLVYAFAKKIEIIVSAGRLVKNYHRLSTLLEGKMFIITKKNQ